MSCGGRVYKGDTIILSVPFDAEDYSNLTITYSTLGDEKIVLGQDEVEIEDGFISHTFEGHDLDLLPDGVIYYSVSYEEGGVGHIESTNTPIYLKTPAGYSGRTADEIYQEGYEAGLEDCSGGTPCNLGFGLLRLQSGDTSPWIMNARQDGLDGYNQVQISDLGYGNVRYNDGYESGYTHATEVERSLLSAITITKNGYYVKVLGGYNRVIVNVPSGETDCSEAFQSGYTGGFDSGFTQGYESGYTAGQEDCSGTSCNIEAHKEFSLTPDNGGQWTIHPSAGYDGIGELTIKDDAGYREQVYTSGYTAGLAACSGGCVLIDEIASINAGWGGNEYFYPREGVDGFSSFHLYDNGYGQRRYNNGYTAGYQSGYDSGYTAGQADCPVCDCSSAVTEAYNSGYTEGWRSGASQQCGLYSLLYITTQADSDVLSIYPTSGTGFSHVSVDMRGYAEGKFQSGYTEGYQSGYTAGQQECPECPSGEILNVSLGADWSGSDDILPGELINEVVITDNGYGEAKHQEGYAEGYEQGFADAGECDCSVKEENAHFNGYNEGKDSVIKSLLAENDTDLVFGYYYTSASQVCLITGEYDDGGNTYYDGNSAFVSMSVNGGSWQPVQKYMYLSSGWTQIRFSGCTTLLRGAFSHRFTPSQQCDMDALKVVSLPSKIDGLTDTYTFHMNDGLRVLASSCGLMRGATNGAHNINVVITHYTGNQRQYDNFPSSGVFFIHEGSTSDWSSVLSNWTHIEML